MWQTNLIYTKNHLQDWFPKLPSYQAFSDCLAPTFQALAGSWLGIIGVDLQERMEYIVDSCPMLWSCLP